MGRSSNRRHGSPKLPEFSIARGLSMKPLGFWWFNGWTWEFSVLMESIWSKVCRIGTKNQSDGLTEPYQTWGLTWTGTRRRLRHTVSLIEINMCLTFIFDVRPGGSLSCLSSHNRGWLPVQIGFVKSQPGLICAQIYTAEYFINTCHVYISWFLHWTFNKILWSIYSITALKTQFKARVVVFHG